MHDLTYDKINYQNPEHYGIKRGIPRDLLEKQMRGIYTGLCGCTVLS
jgi:hypothetical protein